MHILDFQLLSHKTWNPRKTKWQCGQNLDLNPTREKCSGAAQNKLPKTVSNLTKKAILWVIDKNFGSDFEYYFEIHRVNEPLSLNKSSLWPNSKLLGSNTTCILSKACFDNWRPNLVPINLKGMDQLSLGL